MTCYENKEKGDATEVEKSETEMQTSALVVSL